MTQRILRLPEVRQSVGLARSTVYRLMETGEFPRPIPLGGRSVGWLQSDIEAWLNEQAAKAGHQHYNAA